MQRLQLGPNSRRVRYRPNQKWVSSPGDVASLTFEVDSTSHSHLISYKCNRCRTERRIPAPPVLHAEPEPDGNPSEVQVTEASGSPAPDTSAGGPVRLGRQRRKKKLPVRRLPPHFARDVGHVVFRGNEILADSHT
jgi:ribonuclease P protein subunit RPR2